MTFLLLNFRIGNITSMKTIIVVLSVLLFISCKSSYTRIGDKNANYIPYYLKVYEADSLYLTNNFLRSYEILDSLFKKYEPAELLFYDEYKTFVKSSYLIGKKQEAFRGIESLIKDYGYDRNIIQSDSILNLIFNSSKINITTYNRLRDSYLLKTYPKIRNEIIEMKTLDQKYRGRKANIEDEKIKQIQFDSINSVNLIKIFDEIGYPNIKKLGLDSNIKQSNLDITVILLHTRFNDREEYFLPKILDYIKMGECNPEVYGYMYDQMMIYTDRPQKYGTYQGESLKSKDSLTFYRNDIGLPPNTYMKWRMKKLYNIDY